MAVTVRRSAASETSTWSFAGTLNRSRIMSLLLSTSVRTHALTRQRGSREGSRCEAPREVPTETWPGHVAGRRDRGNEADGPLSAAAPLVVHRAAGAAGGYDEFTADGPRPFRGEEHREVRDL